MTLSRRLALLGAAALSVPAQAADMLPVAKRFSTVGPVVDVDYNSEFFVMVRKCFDQAWKLDDSQAFLWWNRPDKTVMCEWRKVGPRQFQFVTSEI